MNSFPNILVNLTGCSNLAILSYCRKNAVTCHIIFHMRFMCIWWWFHKLYCSVRYIIGDLFVYIPVIVKQAMNFSECTPIVKQYIIVLD